MSTVREKFKQYHQVQTERRYLEDKLALSLEIRELWPEAFDIGKCNSKLVDDNGKASQPILKWDKLYQQGRLFVRIIRGDGKFVDINARLVSLTLLKNHRFVP